MMENKTEQQQGKDIIQDAEVINVEQNKRNKSIWILIAIFILLALNAGVYWLWFQQKAQTESFSQQLSDTQYSLAQINDLKQSFKSDFAVAKSDLAALQATQQNLAKQFSELQATQQLTSNDIQQKWALAEVKYLLNVANQRVLLAKDVQGGLIALDLADQRIEAMSDYRFHTLRALIADEKLALSSVADVDVEGMALQLQTALNNVDSLQVLMGPAVAIDEQQNVDEKSVLPASWQQALGEMWQQIRSLVVIRHQQDGAAAVLKPEQRYFLYQNLRLKLETARFALLSSKSSVFDASLISAQQWLEQYFVGDERDAMLALVVALQSKNIQADMPDISSSLTWLQQKGFEQ